MIIEKTHVSGFEAAFRGMRNPFESHAKADTKYSSAEKHTHTTGTIPILGPKDSKLCFKLIEGGSEHRKFMQMIHVSCDIIAPIRWWIQFDTYRFVVKNSSSTMHLITSRYLSLEDFSYNTFSQYSLPPIIEEINRLIILYNKQPKEDRSTRDEIFEAIKDILPESYLQLRTIDTNYESLLNMYRQRQHHRQKEWHVFCDWIETLPLMKEIIEHDCARALK